MNKVVIIISDLQRSSKALGMFQSEYSYSTQEYLIGMMHPSFKRNLEINLRHEMDVDQLNNWCEEACSLNKELI